MTKKERPQIDMFPEIISRDQLNRFYQSSSLKFKWNQPFEELSQDRLLALKKAYRVYRKYVPEKKEGA